MPIYVNQNDLASLSSKPLHEVDEEDEEDEEEYEEEEEDATTPTPNRSNQSMAVAMAEAAASADQHNTDNVSLYDRGCCGRCLLVDFMDIDHAGQSGNGWMNHNGMMEINLTKYTGDYLRPTL